MIAPANAIYIDIPNLGTVRAYADVFGDQTSVISSTWFQVDYRPLGEPVWQPLDETTVLQRMGGWPNFPRFLERALKTSGVTGYTPIDAHESNTAQLVAWFLAKPKTEVNAMLTKWKTEVLLPWLSVYITEVIKSIVMGADTAGTYTQGADVINAQLAGVRGAYSNGAVILTA